MIQQVVKKRVDEAFPKAKDYPGDKPLKKLTMVTESETNVKATCPFCGYPNYLKMGKGIDKKNPNRFVRYSAILCQNRKCKKSIHLDKENETPTGMRKAVVVPEYCLINTFVWDVTEAYLTKGDGLVVLLDVGRKPRISRLELNEINGTDEAKEEE